MTSHVFTRTFDPQVHAAGTSIIMDGIRQRVFCPDRYRLSFHLPAAILGLREPRVYVRETRARRNCLYVATIDLPGDVAVPAEGADRAEDCERIAISSVLLTPEGRQERTTHADVEMVVESAYAEDPARPPDLLARALFAGLATAAVEGRPVHTQPVKKP